MRTSTLRRRNPRIGDRGVREKRLAVLSDESLGNSTFVTRVRATLLEIDNFDAPDVDRMLVSGPEAGDAMAELAAAIALAILEDLVAPPALDDSVSDSDSESESESDDWPDVEPEDWESEFDDWPDSESGDRSGPRRATVAVRAPRRARRLPRIRKHERCAREVDRCRVFRSSPVRCSWWWR